MDTRIDVRERESILASLRELEGPRRAFDARRTLSSLLENLDLRPEHLEEVVSDLTARLDDTQRMLVVEALFLVAIADGTIIEREEQIVRSVAGAFEVPAERVDLLFGSADWA